LYIDGNDRTWEIELLFEHVSGDFFLGIFGMKHGGKGATKVEFRVDDKGVVARFGGLFEPTMAPEMVWFDRVE